MGWGGWGKSSWAPAKGKGSWGKATGKATTGKAAGKVAPWKGSAVVQKTIVKPWVSPSKDKGKGKGKAKGKGKGKKGLFTDLPAEKQAEIQEKWAAKAAEEGRTQVGGNVFTGTVIWRCRGYGWIVPANPAALPKKVKESMASMTAELRSKAEENGGDSSRFAEDVLYFRVCDRSVMEAKIDKDMEVKFKVYVDSKGSGATEVEPV
mmetsp:Transcript_21258/g.46915  ORF Transcript_21258/g.46915 Transcript_21258/m.46915 type:complete len:206 (-) Transcript_21258:260-877(-)|eukprot:CAMPEP_0170608338 /NCGR_PEP_ID=MMETSP0224-20130122/21533_1 /TAXON_ID=285029 /ORGANISM="Togula jolla, Strain CCCM 725" /LENGTH=205 /DNA_ID=CAMNT_0010933561 /DNA_START=58 /DNA_END=675 /DNA_ORIENTATION=+